MPLAAGAIALGQAAQAALTQMLSEHVGFPTVVSIENRFTDKPQPWDNTDWDLVFMDYCCPGNRSNGVGYQWGQGNSLSAPSLVSAPDPLIPALTSKNLKNNLTDNGSVITARAALWEGLAGCVRYRIGREGPIVLTIGWFAGGGKGPFAAFLIEAAKDAPPDPKTLWNTYTGPPENLRPGRLATAHQVADAPYAFYQNEWKDGSQKISGTISHFYPDYKGKTIDTFYDVSVGNDVNAIDIKVVVRN